MGIRIRAETPTGLIQPAVDGLYAVIGGLASAGGQNSIPLDIAGDDRAVLLRDFLSELLVLFECNRRFAVSVEVTAFSEAWLAVTAQTELVDLDHSVFHHEVKAITYHELAIRAIPGGYEATVIVDI